MLEPNFLEISSTLNCYYISKKLESLYNAFEKILQNSNILTNKFLLANKKLSIY